MTNKTENPRPAYERLENLTIRERQVMDLYVKEIAEKGTDDDREEIMGDLSAMDNSVNLKIIQIGSEYSANDRYHSKVFEVNPDAQDDLKEAIDEIYSISGEFHPLRGLAKTGALDDDFFNRGMLEDIFSGHKYAIKEAIGEPNLRENILRIQEDNQNMIASKIGYKK